VGLQKPSSPIVLQSASCSSTSASISSPATAVALARVVQGARERVRDHGAIDQLHEVERRADHGDVFPHGKHLRHADGGRRERLEQMRLGQHIMGLGGSGPRGGRRSTTPVASVNVTHE